MNAGSGSTHNYRVEPVTLLESATPIDDGWPAFPQGGVWDGDRNQVNPVGAYFDAGGMTLRQYAAIALRVPSSGLPWLDDMIRESQRDALAGQALAGKMADPDTVNWEAEMIAQLAYELADAMLEARGRK
jgi:hypothetical protein